MTQQGVLPNETGVKCRKRNGVYSPAQPRVGNSPNLHAKHTIIISVLKIVRGGDRHIKFSVEMQVALLPITEGYLVSSHGCPDSELQHWVPDSR